MSETSINAASDGYRRGVIFGLTMAEVMLLLIFCLLLFLQIINDKMKEAEIALNEAQIEIQSLREDVEILSAKTDEANLSSDFIDLIDSSAILVEAKNPEKVEELKSIFSKDRNA
ncbi:hypothetical protein N9I33_01390, partial [Paracoccaceae bacterium]|nr:hypothetical protein [Paracoccaceae bacterium]